MSLDNFSPGKCAVCGTSPTVKSHIIPRAMAHDLRAGSKHLVSGRQTDTGIQFLQSGRWDQNILCEAHEGKLSGVDDYGIDFVRRYRQLKKAGSTEFDFLSNPDPAKLKQFFLAMIWRKDLSDQASNLPSALGPYAKMIEGELFRSQRINAPLLLSQGTAAVLGKRVPIMTEPHRTVIGMSNGWSCNLGWITSVVILDKRGLPSEWRGLDASIAAQAPILRMPATELQNLPSFRPILAQMKKPRGKNDI